MTCYKTDSVSQTEALAETIAQQTKPPHIFCLTGDLGAGKTAFTKGLARGYGYTGRVSSPTFTIMNIYEGCPDIHHFDLYRLGDEDEFFETGAEGYLYSGITVIEWPDRFLHLLDSDFTCVEITRGEGDDDRIITVKKVTK